MANYGLFKRTTVNGKRRYVRIEGTGAYPKPTAVRVFQSRLINSAFSVEPLELRPIKDVAPSATPAHANLCAPCANHTHDCLKGDCACGCRAIKGI